MELRLSQSGNVVAVLSHTDGRNSRSTVPRLHFPPVGETPHRCTPVKAMRELSDSVTDCQASCTCTSCWINVTQLLPSTGG